jgi:glucose-1-phosphate thymidylyltransferase
MSIVVFEDSTCEALAPISTGRLTAVITCGSLRLVDVLDTLQTPLFGISRPYLRDLQVADVPQLQNTADAAAMNTNPRLMISGRVVPSQANLKAIQALLKAPPLAEPRVLLDRETVVGIIDPPWTISQLLRGGYEDLGEKLRGARAFAKEAVQSLTAFELPHEVIALNMKIIGENLKYRIANKKYEEMQSGVYVADGVKLGNYLTFDSGPGPIVIESGVSVGAYTLLRGPLYIGPKSKILEHSAIKDCVSLGHTTKIGGEVEASVVEPYTNKQHHGFLGHSYLGSWINLGAGTCNSDLKNTYGLVNMEYPVGKAATGMQFLGCVMGDYSKTAINTGIFTGKVIGVCSMMYGFVTSNVPSFVNYARLFGQVESIPPEVMIATQQRVFARRNVQQRDIDIQLINDMYALTGTERDN